MSMVLSPLAAIPPEAFRPLRRSEFQALVDQGLFDGTHVELVGGVLVEMSPQGEPHSHLVRRLNKVLVHAVGDDYEIGVQTPLAVDDISLLEPDLQVLPVGPYLADHPARALLVIEVSASSLGFDLGEKARRYAMAGYPEYWVIDVAGRQMHVHRKPSPQGWGERFVVRDAPLASTSVPAVTVDLAALLDG